MEKDRAVIKIHDTDLVEFDCPGCQGKHYISIGEGPGARWGWNGSYTKPTFTPSILVRTGHYAPAHSGKCWCDHNRERPDSIISFICTQCHSFVTDGQIQFLADCSHSLAGQTVPLPPLINSSE